jgi:hypothetical protein
MATEETALLKSKLPLPPKLHYRSKSEEPSRWTWIFKEKEVPNKRLCFVGEYKEYEAYQETLKMASVDAETVGVDEDSMVYLKPTKLDEWNLLAVIQSMLNGELIPYRIA